MKLIKAIDKASAEKRKTAIEENPDGYKALLLGGSSGGDGDGKGLLERSSKRTDLIQYVLAVVWEVLEGKQEVFIYYHASFLTYLKYAVHGV